MAGPEKHSGALVQLVWLAGRQADWIYVCHSALLRLKFAK